MAESKNTVPIFHARFGKWSDERTLVFGDAIDIPCNIAPMADDEDPHDPKNHIQIATGLYVVAMAGMDDSGICLYQDSGNKGVRFQIAGFSWIVTPMYLYLRDRKSILEITHDNRVNGDRQNEQYRKLHPDPPAEGEPKKIYVFPLEGSRQFKTLG